MPKSKVDSGAFWLIDMAEKWSFKDEDMKLEGG
jgi:hypothetical protein